MIIAAIAYSLGLCVGAIGLIVAGLMDASNNRDEKGE